jgi:hypothetical protein
VRARDGGDRGAGLAVFGATLLTTEVHTTAREVLNVPFYVI